MNKQLQHIKAPIEAELLQFETKFRESMKSSVSLLDTIMSYIVKRKGKQIRPIFVLLTAKLFGEINEKTYRGASLVELLHTATLVHDDVVDESFKRRGFFSINALWKNKIAVLVGDYLLSKGLLLSLDHDDFEALKLLSDAVRKMSEGELLQMEKSRGLNFSEDVYFDIIEKKTASLIAACCAIGAASTGATSAELEQIKTFGRLIGISFQIKDDLLDFGIADIGKPTAIDIKEKKLTLPLIYGLNKADPSKKRHIVKLIRNNKGKEKDVKEIVQFAFDSGGIDYTKQKMLALRDEALLILDTFKSNESKEALRKLVLFVTERQK